MTESAGLKVLDIYKYLYYGDISEFNSKEYCFAYVIDEKEKTGELKNDTITLSHMETRNNQEEDGKCKIVFTQGMRGELARVLTYAALQKQLAARHCAAEQVLAAFDNLARLLPAAPRAPVLCSDADDQPFIDLALAHQATLLTKDRRVLATARRLAPLGARVAQRWNAVNEARGQTANKCCRPQQILKSGGA